MPAPIVPARKVFRMQVKGEEEAAPARLLDLYAFLHDFSLAYEIGRIATDPKYAEFGASRLVVTREDGLFARITDEDRMYLEQIKKESPMDLATVITAVRKPFSVCQAISPPRG